MNRIGKLYFRYGTMGSAKTAMLLTQAYNFEERGMEYLCFKPIVDTREQRNVIRSRIGIERDCRWIYADTDMYQQIRKIFEETLSIPSWLLIDEAQFLTAGQVDQCGMLRPAYRLHDTSLRGLAPSLRDSRQHRGNKEYLLMWTQDHSQRPHRPAWKYSHSGTTGRNRRQ